jgi:hypothetical protein
MPPFSAILRAVLMPLYSPCRADAAIFAERHYAYAFSPLMPLIIISLAAIYASRQLTPPILMLR